MCDFLNNDILFSGILATIESVVQGGDCDASNDDCKLDMGIDIKDEQGFILNFI